jgi:hypothetical protein
VLDTQRLTHRLLANATVYLVFFLNLGLLPAHRPYLKTLYEGQKLTFSYFVKTLVDTMFSKVVQRLINSSIAKAHYCSSPIIQ